jgi:hypothetical protein
VNRESYPRWAIFSLALCLLASLACGPLAGGSPPTATTPPSPTPAVEPTSSPTAPAGGEPTPSPTPTISSVVATSSPAGIDLEGMDLATCPPPGSTMLLKFSANISVEYGEAKIEHVLQDGLLNLLVSGSEGTSRIESAEGSPIPYQMTGSMRECVFNGEGEMVPSASGYCQDGVVYLTILENWGPYEGQMTCEDQVVPFNIPAMGVMRHTGADGQGEAFPLDKGFSSEGAGYTSIRPFAAGSGQHVWTLFYDVTGPVAPQ